MQEEQPVAPRGICPGRELGAATLRAGQEGCARVTGNARRRILRAAIGHDDFADQAQLQPRHQRLQTVRQVTGGVQCGDDDGERRGHENSLSGNRVARNRAGVNAFERDKTKDPSHALDL